MELWNIKDLKPPAIKPCLCKSKEIDIRILDITLKNAISFFTNQQQLSIEAALLSRAIYRLKTKLRSHKEMKVMGKLSRLLRAYLQMQMSQKLESLEHHIPKNYVANKRYTLSKNLVDFILVRLQGLGKLLCRTLETCKIGSMWLQQKIRIGHLWQATFMLLAISARIFVIAKNMLKFCCELYSKLLPFSSSLSNIDIQWLPDDYNLPNKLEEWLNIDWELEDETIEIFEDDSNLSLFNLQDSDDEVEICDEYILVKDDNTDTYEDEIKFVSKEQILNIEEDTGIDLTKEQEVDVGEVFEISDIAEECDQKKNNQKRKNRKRKKSGSQNASLNQPEKKKIKLRTNQNVFNGSPTKPKKRPKRKSKNKKTVINQ